VCIAPSNNFQNQLERKGWWMMFKWLTDTSAYYSKKYLECADSSPRGLDTFEADAECEKYKTKALQAYIVYQMMRDFKIVQVGESLGRWVDVPTRVGPIPNPVDPVAAQYNTELLASFVQVLPSAGKLQPDPVFWFQKDSKGLLNYSARLEAAQSVHGEFVNAIKKLEGQIEQLKMLSK
jgi:hypothetical protein